MSQTQRLAPNSLLLQSSRWSKQPKKSSIWWTSTTTGRGLTACLCMTALLSYPKSLGLMVFRLRFQASSLLRRLQMPTRTLKWRSSLLPTVPWIILRRRVTCNAMQMMLCRSLRATSDFRLCRASLVYPPKLTQSSPSQFWTSATRSTPCSRFHRT